MQATEWFLLGFFIGVVIGAAILYAVLHYHVQATVQAAVQAARDGTIRDVTAVRDEIRAMLATLKGKL